ncbi:MAG: T9SS type A sorting domain-containing protein [Bacteroidales bacterium]|nr:T9SS type A sorting domain-containing protein [Bacteroidales bacterium]
MKKTILSLIAILFCLQSFGQTVRIGNGTDTCNYLPFSPSNWTHYSQQIILASEINADSTSKYITDIFIQDITTRWGEYGLFNNFTILMGNTSASSLSQGYIPHSQMSYVKNSPLEYSQIEGGKYKIHLDTPFHWDRVSNIVITFIKNPGMSYGGEIRSFYSHITSDSLSKYHFNASNYSLDSFPNQGTLTNVRSNFEFNFIGCFPLDSIYINQINPNSVDLSFNVPGDANSWEIECKLKSDTNWNNALNFTSNDTNYVINGLLDNTYYSVRIRSVCSQWNKSEWIESEFKTQCDPITMFPYAEDFSGNICWINLYNTSFESNVLLNAYYSNAYLVSPAIAAHLDSLMISFEATNSNGTLTIGVMNNNYDTNTFQPLLSIPNPLGLYEINLDASTLQGVNNYIGLKQEGGAAYINNLIIDYKDTCPNVSRYELYPFSPYKIIVNCSKFNSVGNGYQIAYNIGDSLDLSIANIITLDDSIEFPYIIEGLSPSTNYSIGIRQICGENNWIVKKEKTYSLPIQIPFNSNFEDTLIANQWNYIDNNSFDFEISNDSNSTNNHSLFINNINTNNLRSSSTIFASKFIKSSGASAYKFSVRKTEIPSDFYYTNLKLFVIDVDTNIYSVDKFNINTYYYNTNLLDIENAYSVDFRFYDSCNINIPYLGEAGTIKRIIFAFDVIASINTRIGLDDVKIEEDFCTSPVLSIDTVLANSVKLNWIRGIYENAWWMYYKKSTDTHYDSIYITDTNSYTLNNLTQATKYNVYMVCECDSSLYSNSSNNVVFTTECEVIDSLPYNEDFSSYPLFSQPGVCWSRVSGHPYPLVVNFDDSKTLYFRSPIDNSCVIVMPELSQNIPISNTMLRFRMKINSPNSYLTIGAIGDVNNMNDFDSIASVANDTINKWQWFEVKLNNYSNNASRIVFRSKDSVNYNYLLLDDLSINTYYACSDIINFSISSIGRTKIKLNWNNYNYNGHGYQVSYINSDSILYPNSETIININDIDSSLTSYFLNGLNGGTNYKIGIRQNCGGPWSYINIKTQENGAEIPYYCNFNDSTERNAWVISNGNAPNKWIIGQSVNQFPIDGYSLYVSSDNGITNNYYGGGSPSKNSTIVASRLIKSDGSMGYILSFNSRIGGEANYDYLKVYVVDEDTVYNGSDSSPYFGSKNYTIGNVLYGGNNGTNPTFSYFCNPSNPDSINNHTIHLPYLGQNGIVKKIMFVWNNDNYLYNQPPASIDNISIISNNCFPPYLISNNITNTSINLSWNKHISDSSWYLYYKVQDSISYDSIHIINDTNIILNNLNPNTSYNFYIRKDCGNTLTDSSPIITITTLCNPIASLPFTEDFDSNFITDYPDCWNRSTNSIHVIDRGYQYYKCISIPYDENLNIDNLYLTLPQFSSSININDLLLTFKMRGGYQEKLTIGVMSDINDETTFDSITTFIGTGSNREEKIVLFNNYLGNGKYIAFKAPQINRSTSQTRYIDIDDIYVNNYNNCIAPDSLIIDSVTNNSAIFNWRCLSINTPSYWLYYKKVDDNVFDSIFTTSMTYNLSGLDHSSLYKVYVRSSCVNEMSDNSDTISFRTQCSALNTFPYTETFENYLSYGLNSPYCWTFNGGNGWNSYFVSLINEDSNTYMRASIFYRTSYISTPEIDEDINLLKLSFSTKSDNVNNSLLVGIMSDISDSTTFEIVRIIPLTANLTEHEVYFNEATLSGNNKYITFKLVNYGSFVLDDIIIDYIPDCSRPSNIVIDNITSTEAEINITSFNNNATSWWLFYKKYADITYDSVYLTSLPYTLSGLDPICRYHVYAKNECGQEMSTKSNVVQFWTSCYEIESIPHLEDFEVDFTWLEYINIFNHFPPCWTTCNNNKPFIVNDPGNYLLRFSFNFYSNYNDYKIAITPRFDNNTSISSLKLSFDYRRLHSNSFDIIVGVISNPDDISTFDSIASFTSLIDETWQTSVVDFSNYAGSGQYVAFMYKNRVADNINSVDIDNVLFEYNSSYPLPAPTNPLITNITDSSALFLWTKGGDESLWDVTLDTTLTPFRVSDTSYTFNNLIGTTSYTAYVRAVDYAISPWVGANFTTLVSIVEGEVETLEASDITDSSATLNGVLASSGNAINNIEMGFLLHNEPQINLLSQGVVKIPISYREAITDFNYNLTNLPSDSTFYYTTYFSNIAGDVYGTVKHFSTLTLSEDIIKEDLTINIFPNPTNNISVLRINNLKEKAIVSIYDLQGRQIKTYDIEANQKELTLNMKDYSPGMYYVKLKTRTINKTNKLIVNR